MAKWGTSFDVVNECGKPVIEAAQDEHWLLGVIVLADNKTSGTFLFGFLPLIVYAWY